MHYDRPVVLSIAGYDPSGGAGVLADIKTLEQHRCLGLGVLTALTVQTESRFIRADWLPLAKIQEQVQPLLEEYPVRVIKIGIVENLEVLHLIIEAIKTQQNDSIIIWDPVIASSTGFAFHKTIDRDLLTVVLRNVYLVTPNIPEAKILAGMEDNMAAARWLSSHTRILLKGGHNEDQTATDYLWEAGNSTRFDSSTRSDYGKHGSGCILSSAIAANLAGGDDLFTSCAAAKRYIEKILNSNTNLLAYHV